VTAGAAPDAVGFQALMLPLAERPTPRAVIEAALRRFATLGVKLEVTELNVFTRTRGNLLTLGLSYDVEEAMRRQADAYADVAKVCLAVPACQGVTLWTFTGRYLTTVERLTRIRDMPQIMDRDYRPTPAAFALRDALMHAERRPVDAPPVASTPAR
jgi:GH35 family endo-1,4-beta-xylanase